MKKESLISKQKGCRLYKAFEEINLAGSVIVRYHENNKSLIEEQEVAYFLCDPVSIADDHLDMLVASGKTIALQVSEENTSSFINFQEYLKEFIAPLVKKSQNHKRYMKVICLKWKSHIDQDTFVSILKFLQHKELCIIIQPQISPQSWRIYQLELAHFTSLLQNEDLLLSAISIVMRLPEIPSQHYAKQLLSIWRRAIPTEVGRLVIQDEEEDRNKMVSQIFYVKDMPICWQMQFITSNTEKCDKLAELSLGLI